MNDKEKYLTKIESRMQAFNTTIEDITAKKELRSANAPEINIKGMRKKHDDALEAIKELKTVDDSQWKDEKTRIDQMVGDIDQELRSALAYYS